MGKKRETGRDAKRREGNELRLRKKENESGVSESRGIGKQTFIHT